MITKLRQSLLDGKEMLNEWQSVLVQIFNGKGNERSCNGYREVKLLEYTLKIVQKMLKRKIRK